MTNRNSIYRDIYLFLLIFGMGLWLLPVMSMSAQTVLNTQERNVLSAVPSSIVGTTEGTTKLAPSSVAASATTTSVVPRSEPRNPEDTPIPFPVGTKPAETFTPIETSRPLADLINIYVPEENESKNTLAVVAVTVIILSAITYGILRVLRKDNKKKEDKKQEEKKCDNIKTLLEQKRKELEDMVRRFPEEKIKEIVKDKILEELKKDENVKKILDTGEDIKDTYDKLQKAIEILQKRYDLCMLSFSVKEATLYKGTIIENSLNDKAILENLKIIKSYKIKDWLLNDVLVHEKQIEKLGDYLNDGPWYMHFFQSDNNDLIIVFKDKIFRIKYSDKATWKEAIEYGRLKGIPEEQLDFTI